MIYRRFDCARMNNSRRNFEKEDFAAFYLSRTWEAKKIESKFKGEMNFVARKRGRIH